MNPTMDSAVIRSAVLVPVPEADAVIGRWRHRHDPVAAAGVPPHVTLVVPWLEPDRISERELEGLDQELAEVKAFDFELTHVDWFARRVLWLAPDPVLPFVEMTRRIADRFETLPWGGVFPELIPHVTVAHAAPGVELVPIAADVAGRLPVRCRAEEVWVMVGGGSQWELRHRVHLFH